MLYSTKFHTYNNDRAAGDCDVARPSVRGNVESLGIERSRKANYATSGPKRARELLAGLVLSSLKV